VVVAPVFINGRRLQCGVKKICIWFIINKETTSALVYTDECVYTKEGKEGKNAVEP